MGDLNGKVGNVNGGFEWCLEKYSKKLINSSGERIIEFCIENKLVIRNTQFTLKEIHKITIEVASRKKISIIDFFLVSKQL